MTKADKEGQRKAPILRFKGFTDDWEQRKLGEVSYIKGRIGWKSLKQSEYVEEGPALIASKHISNGKINWNSVDHIPDWRYEESPEIMLEPNDIIFSKDGSIGNPAVITLLPNKATINSTMMLVRLNKNILSSSFFYQILVSNQFKKLVFEKTSGSSIPHIFQNDMKKFKFYFPQQVEQIKISSLLNTLDNLIALYENKRKLLTVLSQGLSQYLFNFSKEKSAIQMSLSSITLSEAKGIAKENTLSSGNIEYLDTTRLNGGKVKLVSGKKDVDFQDIIVLWDGSNAGKIYYGFSGILGSTLKVFKLKDDINSEYVYYYLKFKQNLILHKFRTPNIPHVSKDFSQRFNLPIPDKEKQNLIANILHLNELQVNLTNKKIKKLKQIKNSLLQKIFL